MRSIITLFITLFIVSSGFSQLWVGAGVQLHSDNFSWNGTGKSPYNQFLQPTLVADCWWKRFSLNGGLSLIHSSEVLNGNFSYSTYGSFGGSGYRYGDYRTAHATFTYLGVRLGADWHVIAKRWFQLAMGISQHWDLLAKERYSDLYRTTYVYYEGDPPTVPPEFYTPPHYIQEPETKEVYFPVLTLDKLYTYTNVGIKPSFIFGRVNVELQLALSFFNTPRVLNEMAGRSDNGAEKFKASSTGYGNIYIANELGISVKYHLSK